jgi:hydrogenase maturation protein HypF
MARDIAVISRFCLVSPDERALLESPEAPIVLLATGGTDRVATSVAPRQRCLGFMLPYTPLHHLLLARSDEPLVMTSGNLSDEPQVIGDEEARAKLSGIAEFVLTHDRAIVNRVDDSVVRMVAGKPRQIRRARGFAPAPLSLPEGFAAAPEILALGAQLKATFCSARGGPAVLSQHLGDLDDAAAFAAYRETVDRHLRLFDRSPKALAVDLHPNMASTRLGEELAAASGLPLVRVQHHHAHAASCMVENGVPLAAPPILAVVLDGLGYGPDGSLWGGEFLLTDYAGYRRLGAFKPTPMPGGERAIREPWRMAFAYLRQAFDWSEIFSRYGAVPFVKRLSDKPLDILERMLNHGINSPLTTSCGRLFDAVASIVGIRERISYEGQAAIELEAALADAAEEEPYPIAVIPDVMDGLAVLDPAPMWRPLLGDLCEGTSPAVVAARFHMGLVSAAADMVAHLAARHEELRGECVALSGGVFQNAMLLESLSARLQSMGSRVLSQAHVPSNDGGIALGQAAVCAARTLGRETRCASACPAGS